MSDYLVVPIEQLQFAEDGKHYNVLGLYLSLKFQKDKFRFGDTSFEKACEVAGISSYNSKRKYLNELVKLKWIWYNPNSEVYHVNGTETIRKLYNFRKRSAVETRPIDLKNIRTFGFAAIVGHRINRIERARRYYKKAGARKSQGFAPLKGSANKYSWAAGAPAFSLVDEIRGKNYTGLSIGAISENVKRAKSTISEQKKKAKEAGYLTYSHRLSNIGKFDFKNEEAKRRYCQAHPQFAHLVRWTVNFKKKQYHLGLQLPDEIKTHLSYKRLSCISKQPKKEKVE